MGRSAAARGPGAVALVALFACAAPFASPPPLSEVPALDPERVARDVAWLADDAREGRGVGTRGLADAARYLAEELRAAGFAPAGDGDSFLHSFEMPVATRVARERLSLDGAALTAGRDFAAFLSSADGRVRGDAVFVGYGISAPEFGYDDYAGVDVSGRIALMLDDRPRAAASPLAGSAGAGFLRRAYKVANAHRHGAAAVLLAPSAADLEGLPGGAGGEVANPTVKAGGTIALAIDRASAERIVASAGGASLDERQRIIERDTRPASAVLPGSRVELEVEIERIAGTVANVVAVRAGSDPAVGHEAVVVGAHYDHLGAGGFGSLAPDRVGEVHNGADDNASGAAGILELARAFAAAPPTRRTLVLAAFTGEEAGLVGSRAYVLDPAVPIADTVAMINLDMVGRLRDGVLVVFGTETASGFDELVHSAAEGVPVSVKTGRGGYAASDQTSFSTRDVPVLFFFTGIHGEYHTPDDDAVLVDAEGESEVLRVVYRVARALLDADGRPELIAREPHGGGGGQGYGPYLGTVPNFTDGPGRGVLLQGVRPGSPAAAAGLRRDDRIIAFDGAPVANLEEYAALLFASRPGQRVEIVVERAGVRFGVEAILGQRR